MPRTTTVVKIFVSSPADVEREREILESLVEEHNASWSESLGVTFDLVRWESDVRPGFSSDPQQVVNEQVGDDYDVFIGILWGRFGTPTPRAASGTREEFDRAYELFNKSGISEVMFYFKDSPIPPSKIDASELARIQAFRQELPDKGGLYGTFEDESGFQTSVRSHLAAVARKFSREAATSEIQRTGRRDTSADDGGATDEEDLGFLDYVELYETRMADLTAALETISDATTRIGEQMERRTEEVRQLSADDTEPKEARRVVRRTADDMDGYADILRKHVPLMASARESALQALSQALTVYQEFGEPEEGDLTQLRDGLVRLRDMATGSWRGLSEYRETVQGLPRLTSDLNRAKRNVVRELDTMLDEITTTSDNVANILDSVYRMIGEER